MTLALFRYVLT